MGTSHLGRSIHTNVLRGKMQKAPAAEAAGDTFRK